jgi:hypothetical protein
MPRAHALNAHKFHIRRATYRLIPTEKSRKKDAHSFCCPSHKSTNDCNQQEEKSKIAFETYAGRLHGLNSTNPAPKFEEPNFKNVSLSMRLSYKRYTNSTFRVTVMVTVTVKVIYYV